MEDLGINLELSCRLYEFTRICGTINENYNAMLIRKGSVRILWTERLVLIVIL